MAPPDRGDACLDSALPVARISSGRMPRRITTSGFAETSSECRVGLISRSRGDGPQASAATPRLTSDRRESGCDAVRANAVGSDSTEVTLPRTARFAVLQEGVERSRWHYFVGDQGGHVIRQERGAS